MRDAAKHAEPEPEFISIAEGARIIETSVATLRRRLRDGSLRGYRLKRSRLIRLRREDLVALLEPLS